jgi:hypothetical protein
MTKSIPNPTLEERWANVEQAIANMRGDINFEAFLDAFEMLKEEAALDNASEVVIRDHAAMAFNSGVYYACHRILTGSR